jgi:hypothetical protein
VSAEEGATLPNGLQDGDILQDEITELSPPKGSQNLTILRDGQRVSVKVKPDHVEGRGRSWSVRSADLRCQ